MVAVHAMDRAWSSSWSCYVDAVSEGADATSRRVQFHGVQFYINTQTHNINYNRLTVMLLLPVGILPSVRSVFGPFRYSLLPCTAIAPFSTTIICHQEPGTHDSDAPSSTPEATLYRYRYYNDPEFRRAEKIRGRVYGKTPQRQEYLRKAHLKRNPSDIARLRSFYKESSAYRRTRSLTMFILYHFKLGQLDENWSWRSHAPLVYPSRVDHHCTACDRDRFLKIWWKEKSITSTIHENRYMCTLCFASDPERIMPEQHPAKLPAFFTDRVDKRSNL